MGSALSNPDVRWPAAVVPYYTKSLGTNKTTKFIREAIKQAVKFYQQYTGFDFVELKKKKDLIQSKDYIQFVLDHTTDIASSNSIGRKGGQQLIHINPDAKDDGEMVTHVLHEMGHALGMPHEQQRSDRNKFVVYHPENVDTEKDKNNFKMYAQDQLVLPASYDYGSRMQYRPNGEGGDKFTLTVNTAHRPELIAVMGTSKLLSRSDVTTLNYIADPLPGGALTSGTWETIDDGHQLVPYGDELIIDWENDTGKYRVWRFNTDANGNENPLAHSNVPNGSFPLVDDGHQLIAVDDALIIDWHPDSGAFRLWDLARPSIKTGHWETIGNDHHLVSLGGHRLLDWDDDGNYRLWVFDQTEPKLLSGPQAKGQWQTIDGDHELVLLGDSNILDRNDDEYRIFTVNREAQGSDNPLTHVLAAGTWKTIDGDHKLVPIGKHRVIDWEPNTGAFHVWRYEPKFDAYPPDPRTNTSYHGQHPSLRGAKALELEAGHLLTWNDKGDYWLWRITYGTGGSDALNPVHGDNFGHNMTGHQLVALPGKRVLDFYSVNDNVGAYAITETIHEYQLDKLPLLKSTVTTYKFWDKNYQLIRLSSDRVLGWVPSKIPLASSFNVWEYNMLAKGTDNPFSDPKSTGNWPTTNGQMIGQYHVLIPLDSGQVIDWVRGANFFRIFQLAIHQKGENILVLPTLAEGFWNDIDETTQIVPLTGGRILEWDAQGNYRISSIAVTPAIPTS
jgi:hypothetical protein